MNKKFVLIVLMITGQANFFADDVESQPIFESVSAENHDVAVDRSSMKIMKYLVNSESRVSTEADAQYLRQIYAFRAFMLFFLAIIATIWLLFGCISLRKKCKSRFIMFFLPGFLFMPLLWIGGIVCLKKASNIVVISRL